MKRTTLSLFLSLTVLAALSLPAYAPPFSEKTDIIYKTDGTTFPKEDTGRVIRTRRTARRFRRRIPAG
jgi:hypothetical protein